MENTIKKTILYVLALTVLIICVLQFCTVNADPFDYTVVYDKNAEDATGTMANSTHTYGTESNLTANGFSRDGYIFKEWNTKATGLGNSYSDGQGVSELADPGKTVTLYAQWVKEIEVTKSWVDGKTGTDAENRSFPEIKLKKTDEAYVSYDSETKTLEFFRDDPGTYTNFQTEGTKIYYTGVESTPNNPTGLGWYNKPFEKVVFKDVISPKSTAYWFNSAYNLKQIDISKLDTSQTTNMQNMFYDCRKLEDLDLTDFDTKNVENMRYMFYGCLLLTNIDASSFDTSNVKDFTCMFEHCSSATSIITKSFNTESAETMHHMFYDCSVLQDVDLRGFDTKNVQSTRGMFYNCTQLKTIDLSTFNTKEMTDIQGMFGLCINLESIDVSNFDTSKVQNMRSLFYKCAKLETIDLSSFKTNELRYCDSMFSGCSKLTNVNLSTFNTVKAKELNSFFEGCSLLQTVDLSSFDTTNVTNTSFTFKDCTALVNVYVSDKWNMDNVTTSELMFSGDTNLPNFDPNSTDKTHANYGTDGYLQERSYNPTTPTVADATSINPELPTEITPPDWVTQTEYATTDDETKWVKSSDSEWTYKFTVREGSYDGWESIVPNDYETDNGVDDKIALSKDATSFSVTNTRTYTIKFHPEGGSFESSTSTKEKTVAYHGTKNNTVNEAERFGYVFDGWFTADGTEVYDENGICTANGGYWSEAGENGVWLGDSDLDLYAQWTELATLTIKKTINEESLTEEEQNIDFTFTIQIGDLNETIDDVEFVDGTATITLKHNESKSIRYLPLNTAYTVTETINPDYPILQKSGDSGTLVSGENIVEFENERLISSGFIITTQSSGNYSIVDDEFSYTVKFNGLKGEREYTFTSETNEPVTFTTLSDGTANVELVLKNGESYMIDSVPKGTTYKITQAATTYTPTYAITNTSSGGNITSAEGSALRNESLSTETETVERGESITVTFSNSRVLPIASGVLHNNKLIIATMLLMLLAMLIALKKEIKFSVR